VQIGGHEVVRELGRGGMGVVYEVRRPGLEGRLALEHVLAAQAGPEALLRFEREARLLARVRHRNVVAVHALEATPQGRSW
jgi:eukaryotic-like serine/threonine-protein kinase